METDDELLGRIEVLEKEVRKNRQRIKTSKSAVTLLVFLVPIIQGWKYSVSELAIMVIIATISIGVITFDDLLEFFKK